MPLSRRIKARALRALAAVHLDSFALEVRDRTWFANRRIRGREADLPPAALMRLVAATTDAHQFLWSGRLTAVRMLSMLDAHGVKLDEIGRIHDFGCGCGRVLRHLAALPGTVNVAGTDTDAANIAYCRENFDGQFFVSGTVPPLPVDSGSADLVISYSVFTHIRAEDQLLWFREMGRVLRPSGWLIFSTHAPTDFYTYPTTAEQQDAYARGQVVALAGDMGYVSTSNYGTFHPPGSVERLAMESQVFQHVSTLGGLPAPPMIAAGQSLHLWQKKP